MRIIPLVLSTILVVAAAAPNPQSYSSARHYQFQRSSSSYRNNELQHKDEEAGVYGRIEDPEKYDKPLEQSHYRQSSYRAPGTDTVDDSSEEDDTPSQTVGIKGGRPNSFMGHGHSESYHRNFGHSANYHGHSAGYHGHSADYHGGSGHSASYHGGSRQFGQGVIDSDFTTGDYFYQPGRSFPHEHGFHHHPPGFNHPSGNHHHGYHRQHGFSTQETSSQSSQNKDDQMISLDQTFDYSKFKDHGFGKEYLENTEGQRGSTPRSVVSTTENIRPIFETTEAIPEQPGFSSQIGNTGRGIQQNQNREQQGQSATTTFGQNSQQGQNIDLSIFGQNSQQGQSTTGVFEDQTTTGQFGSASQMGNNQDNQQQIDIGQSFLQGQTSQQGQSTSGQTLQQGQTIFGQNSQEGQVFNEDQLTTGQFGSASQQDTQQQIDIGKLFQQGQVFNEDQSTTGQIGSASQIGNQDNQQQIDIGQSFLQGQTSQQGRSTTGQTFQQGQSTAGQTFQQGQSTAGQTIQQGQSTAGQTIQQGSIQTGQTIQQEGGRTGQDHLKPLFQQIDKIAEMDSRDQTHFALGTDQLSFGSYPGRDTGRHHHPGHHHEIIQHTTGYIKPKYDPYLNHHHSSVDCNHEKVEEKVEEKQEEKAEEMTTQASFQETITEASLQEDNNMEMMNQERQEEMSGGNLAPMTAATEETTIAAQEETTMAAKEETTTVYYKYHKKHEKEYDQEEDDDYFDQHSNDKQWHGDFQQHQDPYGNFDYNDGQHREDLTQQTQDSFGRIEFDGTEDLTQQHQDGWAQNHKDLSQKQEKHDEEYGHLEFGGQQQEDLSQKNEDFHGSNYGNNGYRNSYGYSTASSRSYSASSSSRTSSSYHQTADLTQNKEQFATEVQDVSQQVQKVEIPHLEEQKETLFEPEEIAVVAEEKPTEKPGFWKRFGGSIIRTYESAKDKVKNNLG